MKSILVILLAMQTISLAQAAEVGLSQLLPTAYDSVIDDIGNYPKAKAIRNNLELIEKASVENEQEASSNPEYADLFWYEPNSDENKNELTAPDKEKKISAFYEDRFKSLQELRVHQNKMLIVYTKNKMDKILGNDAKDSNDRKSKRDKKSKADEDLLKIPVVIGFDELVTELVSSLKIQAIFIELFNELSFNLTTNEINQLILYSTNIDGIIINPRMSMMRTAFSINQVNTTVVLRIKQIKEKVIAMRLPSLHTLVDPTTVSDPGSCANSI